MYQGRAGVNQPEVPDKFLPTASCNKASSPARQDSRLIELPFLQTTDAFPHLSKGFGNDSIDQVFLNQLRGRERQILGMVWHCLNGAALHQRTPASPVAPWLGGYQQPGGLDFLAHPVAWRELGQYIRHNKLCHVA